MQRKNYLLRQRGGFAMIMALAVIVIISTIMAISISMTTTTTKKTTDLYLYEQAILLSKSAAEYALLRISQNPPCTISTLNFTPDLNNDGSNTDDLYDINISIKYIYTAPSPCNAALTYATVTNEEQNGSALMDITVSVPASKNITSEPITYFRRSIQKL